MLNKRRKEKLEPKVSLTQINKVRGEFYRLYDALDGDKYLRVRRNKKRLLDDLDSFLDTCAKDEKKGKELHTKKEKLYQEL